MACRGQDVEKGPEVNFCPAVVVGLDDAYSLGEWRRSGGEQEERAHLGGEKE